MKTITILRFLERETGTINVVVGEGMFHAYPVFPVVKEAKEGWKQMIRLVKENA